MPSKVTRECKWCAATFEALLKEVNRGKGNFCSVSCANAKRSADRKIEGARKLWIDSVRNTPHYIAQRKAHHAVEEAIKRNKLFRLPCEVCGSSEMVHAHHEDYTKPLDVRWLCVAHHREHHG